MDRDVRAGNVRCLPAGTIKRGGRGAPFIWQTRQTANPISSPGLKGLKNGLRRGRDERRKVRRRKGEGREGGEGGEEVRKRGGSITGQDGNR